MSTAAVAVTVIVAVVVIVALGLLVRRQQQRRRLRERFGPEYDRTVERHDSAREAEQELLAREQRHHELPIRPLEPAARDRYRAGWQRVQEQFVDSPRAAVTEADNLLIHMMRDRGYPTENYEQQFADLSVEHAATLDRYRTAHDIRGRADADQATTEDLRQAMVHYRALFSELLGDGESPADPARTTAGHRSRTTSADGRPDTAPVDGHPEAAPAEERTHATAAAGGSAASRRDAETSEGRSR